MAVLESRFVRFAFTRKYNSVIERNSNGTFKKEIWRTIDLKSTNKIKLKMSIHFVAIVPVNMFHGVATILIQIADQITNVRSPKVYL